MSERIGMLPLRDYQEQAIVPMTQRGKMLLGDEQGLGKTRTTLASALKLLGDKPTHILVFCPKIALGVWRRELKKWFDLDSIPYTGNDPKHIRDIIWQEYQEKPVPLIVATYAMVGELLSRRRNWSCIIADEYHKGGLMNRTTKTFKNFKRLYTNALFLLSGTPVKKGPQDLFAPLHLINPYEFSSYWKFVHEHCVVIEGVFGREIGPKPKNPSKFAALIKPYLIRRTKKRVLKELPALQRQSFYLDMTSKQAEYYNELAETGILETGGDPIICPNEAVKILRLRQILVSPRVLGLDEDGAALEALLDMAEDLFVANRPIVVATPFRAGVDEIAKALKRLTSRVYSIKGGMDNPSEVAEAFQNDKHSNRALVFTISSAMAFDAYTSSDIFFVGTEWVAIDNKQAEARLHRLGQEDSVDAYYLLHSNTIDDAILERLDSNQMAANWVLNTQQMLELLRKQRGT